MSVARAASSLTPPSSFMPITQDEHSKELKIAYETFKKVSENVEKFVHEMRSSNIELPRKYLKIKNSELIDGIALYARRIKLLKTTEASSAKLLSEKLEKLFRIATLHIRCLNLTPDSTHQDIQNILTNFLEKLEKEIPFLCAAADRNVMDQSIEAVFTKVIDRCDEILDGVKLKGRSLREHLLAYNDSKGCIRLDSLIQRVRVAALYIGGSNFIKDVEDTKTKHKIQLLKNDLEKLSSINNPIKFHTHLQTVLSQLKHLYPSLLDVTRKRELDPIFKQDFLELIQTLNIMTAPLTLEGVLFGDFILPPDERLLHSINIQQAAIRLWEASRKLESHIMITAIRKKIIEELFQSAYLSIENAEISMSPNLPPKITRCIEFLWDISHIIASTHNSKSTDPAYICQFRHLLHCMSEKLRHIYIGEKTILEFLAFDRSPHKTLVDRASEIDFSTSPITLEEHGSYGIIKKSPEFLISQLLENLDLIRVNGRYVEGAEHQIWRKWEVDCPDFYISDDSDVEGS